MSKTSAEGDGAPLHVVFLLDITGSMGEEIEAVKCMIFKFCSTEHPGIKIYIWTFTESERVCYVSKSPPDCSSNYLMNYVNGLEVCCPPDFPKIRNANGGDGPENVVAGVVSLLHTFNASQNIICFIITDDAPHHFAYGTSSEAIAEKKWLIDHNHTEQDAFKLLNSVIEELNVTFIPLLYGDAAKVRWYHQAAVLTQGLVLCPKSRNSSILANGLTALLESFHSVSVARRVTEISNLDELVHGFSIVPLDEANFTPIEEDFQQCDDCFAKVALSKNKSEIQAALLGLMETTCDRFRGKKSGKRCSAVNPRLIAASVRVLTMSMLKLINSPHFDGEKFNSYVSNLFQELHDSPTDTSQFETSILNRWIEKLDFYKEELRHAVEVTSVNSLLQPVQCVITLESALDFLNGLEQLPSTEADVTSWMEIVEQLSMCRLLTVSFPLDVNGCQDFGDAWSASIRKVETSSVLTVFSAAKLRDEKKVTCDYQDPISRRIHNGAIILAHPNDMILTRIFTGMSALPSLQGLLQSYLVSGGLKVFPSILPGLQSSCLLFLLHGVKTSGTLVESTWEVARCLVWSLQQSMNPPAAKVVRTFKKGDGLNPADAISKLLAAVISFVHKTAGWESTNILELLFEELSASAIGAVYRKRLQEQNSKDDPPTEEVKVGSGVVDLGMDDSQIANCFVKTSDVTSFDPRVSLHPIETVKENLNLEDGLNKLITLVSTTEKFKNLVHIFKTLYNLLKCDVKGSTFCPEFSTIPSLSDEKLASIYAKSLILRKRTGRYVLTEEKEWKRVENDEISKILRETVIDNISTTFTSTCIGWTVIRRKFAMKKLLERLSVLDGDSVQEFNTTLSTLGFVLAERRFTLGRMDVPAALKKIPAEKLRTLGVALCIGTWTPQPPSNLRRRVLQICEVFAAHPEVVELIKREILKESSCSRPPENPNRHGHHSLNIYPGIANWTEEYQTERLKVEKYKTRVRRFLEKMKAYTEFAHGIRTHTLPTVGENRRVMIEWMLTSNERVENKEVVTTLVETIAACNTLDVGPISDDQVRNLMSTVSSYEKRKTKRGLALFFKFLSTIT